jgi:hypothetical protein
LSIIALPFSAGHVVDELAHTNIPGSTRTKHWEDVQVLLDAGLEVWTTINVQHIESLNDQVWQITGIQVRETVPDGIIRQAAEIVAVDVTPDALLNRLKRGAVYRPEMVEKALTGFFKGSNLGALRELTLRQAAHEVDLRQSAYDETRGFQVPRISEARPGGSSHANFCGAIASRSSGTAASQESHRGHCSLGARSSSHRRRRPRSQQAGVVTVPGSAGFKIPEIAVTSHN